MFFWPFVAVITPFIMIVGAHLVSMAEIRHQSDWVRLGFALNFRHGLKFNLDSLL